MVSKIDPRPGIGVAVLIWRQQQLLLGRRRQAGNSDTCWQFPGGHLELEESVIECARREVLEETGLEIKAMRHLGFTDQSFTVGLHQYVTLFVSCEYLAGEARVLEPDRCECWQWFDYQQLPEPLFEPIELFLSQLFAATSGSGDLSKLHQDSNIIPDIQSGVHR